MVGMFETQRKTTIEGDRCTMSDYSSNDDARREAARKRLQQRQARLNQTEAAENPLASRIQSMRPERGQANGDGASFGRSLRRPAAQQQNYYEDASPLPEDEFGYEEDVYTGSYDDEGEPERPQRKPRQTRQTRARATREREKQQDAPSFNAGSVAETLKSIGAFIVHYARIAGAAIAKGARFVARHAVALYHRLVERFGSRNTNIGLAVVAVLLLLLILLLRSCATPADPGEAALRSASQAVSAASFSNDDGAKPDQDYLVNLMGNEGAAAVLNAASQNADVYWIASHPTQFEQDGYNVEAKIFMLAANEPAAASYVRHWPDRYPQESPASDDATPNEDSGTSVPRLYQWDERWGYTVYSGTAFGITGCCPTALAMVYQALSHDTSVTPYDVAMLARNNGYETESEGTDASFLVHMAGDLGMACTELSPAATNLRTTLNAGHPLIINVGPGDFTENGHFIVATGLDSSGKVIINDPYSAVRSSKTWDVDTLVSQARSFYAYTYA